jgi:hypothetical protein
MTTVMLRGRISLIHRFRASAAAFAIIVLSVSHAAGGNLQILGPSCFTQEIENYLANIRRTYPEFVKKLDYLDNEAPRPTIIARGFPVGRWKFDGSAYIVNASADLSFFRDGRYDDGVCLDSIAALVHELMHAYESQNGTIDRSWETLSSSFIKTSEIHAVQAENAYREANRLCPRTTYDKKAIPAWAASMRECTLGPETCTPRVGLCEDSMVCCWVYNLDDHGGACLKEISREECDFFKINSAHPGVNSKGHEFPCSRLIKMQYPKICP